MKFISQKMGKSLQELCYYIANINLCNNNNNKTYKNIHLFFILQDAKDNGEIIQMEKNLRVN